MWVQQMHYDPTVGLLVRHPSWPAIPLFFCLIHNHWSWFSQPGLGTIPGSFLFPTSKYLSPYRSPLLGSLKAGHGLYAGSHIFNNQLRWQCLRKSSLIPDAACTSTHTQTSAKSRSDPLAMPRTPILCLSWREMRMTFIVYLVHYFVNISV